MNTASLLDQEIASFVGPVAPRRRGRPKGSKNKHSRPRAVRPTQPPNQRDDNRDGACVMMRESGATYAVIGAEFGVSRERARQIVARNGYGPSSRPATVDPLAAMRLLRASGTQSYADIAEALRITSAEVRHLLDELGARAAADRLLRWRRTSETKRQIVGQLRAFYASTGRSPYAWELGAQVGIKKRDDLPWFQRLQRYFGNIPAAFAAAGIPRRGRGTHGHAFRRSAQSHCRRGHAYTPENTYTYTTGGRTARHCKACRRLRSAADYQRKKLAAALPSSPPAQDRET